MYPPDFQHMQAECTFVLLTSKPTKNTQLTTFYHKSNAIFDYLIIFAQLNSIIDTQ